MSLEKTKQIVFKFIEQINRQDADGLGSLMAPDHAFID